MSDEGKNFPEPATAVERITLKGAELLDQDVFDKIGVQNDSGTWVKIWGATFYNVGGVSSLKVGTESTIEGPWKVVGTQDVPKAFAAVFNEAFDGAVRRQKERDLERVEKRMVAPVPPPAEPIKPKGFWYYYGELVIVLTVAAGLLGAAFWAGGQLL